MRRSLAFSRMNCAVSSALGRVKGALYFQGGAATGIQFGRSQVVARLYNKLQETKEKGSQLPHS
jgi:hypothetical protein